MLVISEKKIKLKESINLEKTKICSEGGKYYLYDEEKKKMFEIHNLSDEEESKDKKEE